jgi:hypothetical protein
MVQAVSHLSLAAKVQVRAWVSLCGICGGQSGIETRFLQVLGFPPVCIIPLWLSILMYHLGDEQ